MCFTRWGLPIRCRPPLMLVMQPASQATTTGAPLASMFLILRFSMAVDSSGCSTENTPPKPQHSVVSGSSTSSASRTAAQESARLAVHTQVAQQVAGGMVGDLPWVARSQVGDSQPVHQELGQLEGSLRQGARPGQPVRVAVEELRVSVPDHGHARAGWRHDVSPGFLEDPDGVLRNGARLVRASLR